MKKLTVLLALVLLTSQLVGCGLFRRVRDHLCRGAYCGATSAGPIIPRPGILAPQAPQTIVAPTPPVVIPQASCVPCEPCVTCSPVCDPCCNGLAYPMGVGYGGCGCEGGAVYDGAPVDGGVQGLSDTVFPSPAN